MPTPTELIKELREITGAGIMECKKALEDATGDLSKAQQLIKERGLAMAEKKAGREASLAVALSTGQKLLRCNQLGSVPIAVRHHGEILTVEPASGGDISRLRRGSRRAVQTAGSIGIAVQRKLKRRASVARLTDRHQQLAFELDGGKERSFRSIVLGRRSPARQSFGFIAVPERKLQPR